MKLSRILSLLLVLSMLLSALASCELFNSNSTDTTTTTGNSATPDPDEWAELYDIITVAEALEIAEGASTATDAIYYVRGTIVTISNRDYGEMTISDGTGEILVYNTKGADKSTFFPNLTDAPVKGDEVLLLCSLLNYNGTLEVKQAYLIDFHAADKEDIDVSSYTEMTVAEAREAAEGTNIKLTGTVAAITYANGKKPNGVYIVDGTDSIYIYDGDIAGQVKVGNTITVLGSKTYWILNTEQNNAKEFGYTGCCQLESAVLYENDKAISEVDLLWCEEKTVKEILANSFDANVTTTIYKTTALVTKSEGTGFTNYYFNDLDGFTGTYTYTNCNGSDFGWLDEFDGKICTVYISLINAKSTSSGCVWRFLPIKVADEGFTFDLSKAPEYAIEYHIIDQILSTYTGNPQKELPTSVSSELLGFENVTISYESDNESIVYFTVNNPGATVLNCGEAGTAKVTITATYGEYTHSETIEITVATSSINTEYIKVAKAITTEVGSKVTVKGIVGPSVVNQTGFYLIDETGAIAVLVNDSIFKENIAIGDEVTIEGTLTITKNGGGQLCLDNTTIIANNYGGHSYSTQSFITDKTFTEIITTADTPQATAQIYIITAKIKLVASQFYSNIYLTNGTTDFILYCSNASQYSWLNDYDGQEITVEFALCDWNAKGLKGAVLSVITADGKIFNTYNFDKYQQ